MKKIASFEVDHIKLEKGLYVSRIDPVGETAVTTFDLRMKKPNQEALDIAAIHTLEHLVATFVRNHESYGSKIVYFGPMGCLTGMYLIVQGELTSTDVLPLVTEAFEFSANFEGEIPGVSAVECGNYKLHNLEGAKAEAKAYAEILRTAGPDRLNYPV